MLGVGEVGELEVKSSLEGRKKGGGKVFLVLSFYPTLLFIGNKLY